MLILGWVQSGIGEGEGAEMIQSGGRARWPYRIELHNEVLDHEVLNALE